MYEVDWNWIGFTRFQIAVWRPSTDSSAIFRFENLVILKIGHLCGISCHRFRVIFFFRKIFCPLSCLLVGERYLIDDVESSILVSSFIGLGGRNAEISTVLCASWLFFLQWGLLLLFKSFLQPCLSHYPRSSTLNSQKMKSKESTTFQYLSAASGRSAARTKQFTTALFQSGQFQRKNANSDLIISPR